MDYSQLLSDCWAYGASYLPLCGLPTWASAFLPQLGGGEIISLGNRRFRVLQKLGEGGYAVVYLVSELATADHPYPDPVLRALKKVLVPSSEHLYAVQQEMLVHSAVQHHPNVLPLLDYSCSEGDGTAAGGGGGEGGGGGGGLLPSLSSTPMLTPPLLPLLPPGASREEAGAPPPAQFAAAAGFTVPMSIGGFGGGGGGVGSGLTPGSSLAPGVNRMACFLFPVFRDGTLASELERLGTAGGPQMMGSEDVLAVFTQLAKATAHVHAHAYAHRDIKPLNVLIAKNPDHPAARKQQQQPQRQPGRQPGRRGDDAGDVEAGVALTGAGADTGTDAGPRYRCVLMDFGSARPRTVQVTSRNQAMQLQEDAEAHCSAPYRAPELFDVPSPSSLDYAAADVWALGASLFHIMYGEPPFHRAMTASGGSLALAVLNCAIGWPRPPAPAYPTELHQLVTTAMDPDPAARPSAAQLVEMAAALAQRGLPDPAPQAAGGGAAVAARKR